MEYIIELEKKLYLDIINDKSKDFDEYSQNAMEISNYYYGNKMKNELAGLECRVNEILLKYVREKFGINDEVLNNYEYTFGVRDYY